MIENCDALRAFLRPGLKSLYFILLKRVIISDCRLIFAVLFYELEMAKHVKAKVATGANLNIMIQFNVNEGAL